MSSVLPEQRSSFKDKQAEFSAFIRAPSENPMPADVKPQRMLMYRELFFNNINSFLTSNFPVLQQILEPQQWLALAQDFFSQHACKTPYFSEIPEEFIYYLQNEREAQADDPPFMLELAHYEWVEMALSISKEQFQGLDTDFTEHIENYSLAISALAWPLVYQYPVHRLAPDFQPSEAPQQYTYLVVYRDGDLELRFLEISAMTFQMLQILQDQPGLFAKDYLAQLLGQSEYAKQTSVVSAGLLNLQNMARLGIINKA